MEDVLENPVIRSDDADMAALEAAAQKVDSGEDATSELEQIGAAPKTEEAELETAAAALDKSLQPAGPTRDEQGRFTKADGTKSLPGEKAPEGDKVPEAKATPDKAAEGKTETAYEKAKKETERQTNLLKNFEQEKQRARAEIDAERQRIAQERAEFERQRKTPIGPQTKFSSAQYVEARNDFIGLAKKATAEGDTDKAQEYLDAAEKAEVAARTVYAEEQKQQGEEYQQTYRKAWEQDMVKTMQGDPDLRDPQTPVSKALQALLGEPDPVDPRLPSIFERLPNGFAYAVQVAKLRVDAQDAKELRKTNAELKAENERLQKLTSLGGNGPTSRVSPKSADAMSISDLEKSLERAAGELDRQGVPLMPA